MGEACLQKPDDDDDDVFKRETKSKADCSE